MSDYRIEAATKEEWANRALIAEAKLTKTVSALNTIVDNGGAGAYHLARIVLAELEKSNA